jgi:glycosyltransferase involved in cell wall biosynthesis
MAQSRESARERLALGPSARIVLIAGRLISGKRPDVALSAADLIPDARVVVLGGGPLEAELSRRYPSAEFLGQVHHPIALLWLAAADVVISASRIEGAPTSVREARAARTPVVSVHAGDLLAWSASDQELWLVG